MYSIGKTMNGTRSGKLHSKPQPTNLEKGEYKKEMESFTFYFVHISTAWVFCNTASENTKNIKNFKNMKLQQNLWYIYFQKVIYINVILIFLYFLYVSVCLCVCFKGITYFVSYRNYQLLCYFQSQKAKGCLKIHLNCWNVLSVIVEL